MAREAKMQHCWFCGKELGVYVQHYADRDTCGDPKCSREAAADIRAERDDAHEQLDRDMGWSA